MNRNELDEVLERQFAKFYGQVTRHVDGRIDELKAEMTGRLDDIRTSIDGLAQRIATDEAERARHY